MKGIILYTALSLLNLIGYAIAVAFLPAVVPMRQNIQAGTRSRHHLQGPTPRDPLLLDRLHVPKVSKSSKQQHQLRLA